MSELYPSLSDRYRYVRPEPNAPQFEQWWAEMARTRAADCAAKAVAYGNEDLYEIGRELLEGMGYPTVDQALCYEAGVYFYARGKMARWWSALRRGHKVNPDTLKDIDTYVMMATYNRVLNLRPNEEEDQ